MNFQKIVIAMLFVVTAGIVILTGCKKETSSVSQNQAGKQKVMIYLNDDPVPNLTKVLVDIRYVEVKVDTGSMHHDDQYYEGDHDDNNDHQEGDHYGKWDTLTVTPRVYDLLKLKNGTDTLIANGFANTGHIFKIRITLGTNNEVWTDSLHNYPLNLCDNHPYLYVKVNSAALDSLPGGGVRIRVDFNVANSVDYDNGHYCLEPKLKSYSDNTTGKMEGIVKPHAAHPVVMAYNSTDTAYAIPEEEGEFKIRGLKPSVYSVLYKASAPYKDTIITNVTVLAGNDTHLSPITLHQ